MDSETWVITPITTTTIFIIIGIPLLCLFAGLDALFIFIHNHISAINIVCIIAASLLAIITIIGSKKPIFLLTIPSTALALSQFLYMLINGSNAIYLMDKMYLAAFWRLIVFVIWLVYAVLNLVVCFGTMGFGAYSVIRDSIKKTNDFSDGILSMIAYAIAGGVGWVINFLFI